MNNMSVVNLAEMYTIMPIPTTTVASDRNPSLSSRVSDSPTMLLSLPKREMTSPTPRTPTSGVPSVPASDSAELNELLDFAGLVEGVLASSGEIAEVASFLLFDSGKVSDLTGAAISFKLPLSSVACPMRSYLAMSSLSVLPYACSRTRMTILWPAIRISMLLPVFAAAPMANIPASIAAAVGTDTGKSEVEGEVKKSMMRPSVKGTESETAEETVRRPNAIPSVFFSGIARRSRRRTSPMDTSEGLGAA